MQTSDRLMDGSKTKADVGYADDVTFFFRISLHFVKATGTLSVQYGVRVARCSKHLPLFRGVPFWETFLLPCILSHAWGDCIWYWWTPNMTFLLLFLEQWRLFHRDYLCWVNTQSTSCAWKLKSVLLSCRPTRLNELFLHQKLRVWHQHQPAGLSRTNNMPHCLGSRWSAKSCVVKKAAWLCQTTMLFIIFAKTRTLVTL